MKLTELADLGKKGAEMNCTHQVLVPVLIMDTPEGIRILGITTPDLGDVQAEKAWMEKAIRNTLREAKATQYAHVVEGWGTTFIEASNRVQGQIRDLPPDDREDIAIVSAIRKGRSPLSFTSVIDTLPDGTRKVREWSKAEQTEGRMVITEW